MPVSVANPSGLMPEWLKPENASVMDPAYRAPLRKLVKLLGLDDPNQIMAFGTPIETGSMSGGALDAIAARFPRFAAAIKAFHGSPHDFDKFSTAKIGTGEGAQAYGHGLYFAESRDVAEGYAPRDPKFEEGLQRLYKRFEKAQNYDAMEVVESAMLHQRPDQLLKAYPNAQSVVEEIKKIPRTDKLYEVSINAHPDQFLDWDKPLSQQSEHVQKALGIHADPRDLEAEMAAKPGTPEYVALTRKMDTRIGSPSVPDVTGAGYYRSDVLRQSAADEAALSAALQAKGIAGIKYLDQGSRAAGEGTRNYVVFDANTVDILRKYGILAPLMGGAGAAAASQSQVKQ